MKNKVTNATLYLSLVLTLATIITMSIADFGTIKAYGQSMTATTPGMNNTAMQQHAAHILDNLIISEHIPLTGQLTSGDYMLLMDFTPFATSVEGHSHIAMKAPCNQDGSPKVTIVAGVSPNLSTLNMGNAINNGTLNGKNLDLSNEGKSCLYRAELPNGITDIALINTSNGTLNFNEGGYSVTVSVHGTAIQHIAK
jgi:acyl-[acyl carrier protein]--UDP-N-acetylglucosamine O-acyltransferase